MSVLTLQIKQGTSRDFQLQATNLDGTPAINLFQVTDVLLTNIWSGDGTLVLLAPTTTWINATQGQFQISLNNVDTATLVSDVYRIQTTATRSGRSAALFDGRLQVTSAPGVQVLTDLITQDYLTSCLADISLSQAQIQFLPQLTRAASRLIRKHCNRWFNRRPSADSTLAAYDGLYTLDWPSKTLVLRQFPVNGVLRARTTPTQVFNVTNTDLNTNQQAFVSLTYTGLADISDVPPATTGIKLTTIASGVTSSVSLTFTGSNITFQGLANTINALGNGWSASITEPKYGLWPTADLRQGIGPSCAIGTFAQQGFWVHTEDVPIQVDQESGLVVLEEGVDSPWSSPRFGTYLDTGLGDLDIGGGLNGVRISYDAGWDTVPEDIQQATIETVQDMMNVLNIDQRLQSETDGAYSYDLSKIDRYALPPSVLGKIGYYRNIRS